MSEAKQGYIRGEGQANADKFAIQQPAPHSAFRHLGEFEHFVQFYESDAFLLNSLSEFIAMGLSTGDACMVLATEAHREALVQHLEKYSLDTAAARESGQFVLLDAAETLSKFMVDGTPQKDIFTEQMSHIIGQAAQGQRRVRVFGEMVALLWAEDNYNAAIFLEGFWDELCRHLSFTLFCAYPVIGSGAEWLGEVCAAHSRVIPGESYTAMANPVDRLRVITLLQQKAKLLETEIAERKQIEKRLRDSEIRFRHLFESSTDGILILDFETQKIFDANPAMSELLGAPQAELSGRELWEIGLLKDREACRQLLQELRDNHIVHYDHLSLVTRNGRRRDVELISTIYQPNGHLFVQCNVRDITERQRAEQNSRHLAAIVESSDDAIVSKTLEGVILSWNAGAERLFGYTADEIIGKSIHLLIPPDRVDEEADILGRLRRGERTEHYETIRLAKGGRAIHVSLTISPIKDKDSRIIAASKIARDVTERKQTEERLRQQAEVIETINHTGRILSAELNLQNIVKTVTDAATELTGAQFGSFFYNVKDERGESYLLYTLSGASQEAFAHFPMPRNTDLFDPTFRGYRTVRLANVKKDPRYGQNPPYHGMPPGHLPVTSYLAVPVVSNAGEVLGGLFFGHSDEGVFTERHEQIIEGLAAQAAIAMDNARLYEVSQREREKAEAANRAKDEFLATVSHELRTPLNAIIGWSHMLRTGNPDQTTISRGMETIERNARAQAQVIEDILDVSRVITGKLRLNIEPVDVVSIIQAAIHSVQLAAKSKNLTLNVRLDPAMRRLSGDAGRLQQVIWNLLSNAIKFTPEGGRIEVRLEDAGDHARIVVSDTGKGIHPEFLPFVFDRFRQADGSSTRRHGGLGLGLAIVRHLVELHGGTVHAYSEGEGQGSTFAIRLPLPADSKRGKDRKSGNEDDNRNRQSVPRLDGVRVLVVDDDPDTLAMLKVALTQYGATADTAASAAEAMAALQGYEPDVLVCDLAMPDEDGYSLIGKVRALEAENRKKQMPTVALTAYVRVEDRVRALSAGFNVFVPKPIEPDELILTIASLTEMSRQ